MPPHYIEKVQTILTALPTISWANSAVGVITLFVLTQWHKLRLPVPGHFTCCDYWYTDGVSLRDNLALG